MKIEINILVKDFHANFRKFLFPLSSYLLKIQKYNKIGMLHIKARNVPSDIKNTLYIILRLHIKGKIESLNTLIEDSIINEIINHTECYSMNFNDLILASNWINRLHFLTILNLAKLYFLLLNSQLF